MTFDLKYWKDGEPVLLIENAAMRELKYWLNGEPYIYTMAAVGFQAAWARNSNQIIQGVYQ